jgi:hypothetical protein
MYELTVIEWFRQHQGWKRERCSMCVAGMTSAYGWDGDFLGPKECDACGGNGSYWVTPRGRHVLRPGGPFC